MAKLLTYASGSGSLSFCWIERQNATGRKVTKGHVGRFLATKEGQERAKRGWRRYCFNGLYCLAKPLERIDANHLRYYAEDKDSIIRYEQRGMFNIECFFTIDGKEYILQNQNMRAVVCFYLEHEKEMNEQDANRDNKKPWL